MKKTLKWIGIVIAVILVLILIGFAALPFIFPLEKIKALAIEQLSASLRREVRLEKVSFNLFSGIRLEKLYIGNRAGFAQKPFVAADAIELRYAFWPLFSRQLLIKEVRLVRPEILIEKNSGGEFNFSDLMRSSPQRPTEKRQQKTGETGQAAFDLLVAEFSVRGGKLTYVDRAAGSTSEIKNLNVKISGFGLALAKPIRLAAAADVIYEGKTVPLSLSGSLGLNLAAGLIDLPRLTLSIAGETLSASGSIRSFQTAPNIVLSLSSKRLNVDPLLAIFAATTKTEKPKASRPGELTASVNRALAAVPANLAINGQLNLENITVQKFRVDKVEAAVKLSGKRLSTTLNEVRFYGGLLTGGLTADLRVAGLSYSVQGLKLTSFKADPFSNSIVDTFLTRLSDYKDLRNKVYGTLDLSASLQGRGVEPQDILANLSGSGSLAIKSGELKRVKTLAEIGKTIKSNSLQGDIRFGSLSSDFSIHNQVISAKNFYLDSQDYKILFKGGVDLGRLAWVAGNRLTLKLSPATTKDLPSELSLMRDKAGWLELTFEMTGELKKPVPRPIFEKAFEAAAGKLKVNVEAKKVEIEKQAKEELNKQQEEAKKAVEEEAKKQLKDLIKF